MSVVSRLALPLLAGAALGVLAACGPGASPVAPEPVETEGAADIEPETEDLSVVDENGDHRADNADEAHDHAHDGDEHDHDDDHAHAGGAAHVHGVADLALVLEGNSLTAEMISPLANFGLSESEGVISDAVIESLSTMILLTGGNCMAETPEAEIDRSSGHTDAHVTFSWTCADPASLMSASFAGFATYPGFETINVVFLDGSSQKSAELTPGAPQISLR